MSGEDIEPEAYALQPPTAAEIKAGMRIIQSGLIAVHLKEFDEDDD